jgi:hypothetical protein
VCAARDLLSFLGDRHQIIVQTGVTDVTNLTADALSEAEKELKAKSEGLWQISDSREIQSREWLSEEARRNAAILKNCG